MNFISLQYKKLKWIWFWLQLFLIFDSPIGAGACVMLTRLKKMTFFYARTWNLSFSSDSFHITHPNGSPWKIAPLVANFHFLAVNILWRTPHDLVMSCPIFVFSCSRQKRQLAPCGRKLPNYSPTHINIINGFFMWF